MMLFKDSDLMKIKDASVREALSFVMERYNDSFRFCYIDRNKNMCLSFKRLLTLNEIKDVIIQFKHYDVPFKDITLIHDIDFRHKYDEDTPFTEIFI
jgi:hypothetical protein